MRAPAWSCTAILAARLSAESLPARQVPTPRRRTPARPTAVRAIDPQAFEALVRAARALQSALTSATPDDREGLRTELAVYREQLRAARSHVGNSREAEILEWYQSAEPGAQSILALLSREREDRDVRGMSEDIARTLQAATPTPVPEGSSPKEQREAALRAVATAIGHGEALLFHRPTPTPAP